MKFNKKIFALIMSGVMAASGFTAFASTNDAGDEIFVPDIPSNIETDDTQVINITNTHSPELIDIPVNKVWNDNDDQDGFRPDEVVVNLYNGETLVSSTTLSEDTGWTYTFEDLYKYENGYEINYTVEEETVSEYTAVITGDVENGFTITNTHTADTFNIEGTKIWNDDNDRDGIRPDEVIIKLFADNEDTGLTATASEDTNWKYEFADLPKYEDGELITYSVQEVPVEGYTAEYVVE